MRNAKVAELNLLDEGFVDIDSPREPWSIQLEVRASGKLDRARLEDALRSAVATHPMARASLRRRGLAEWRRAWEIPPELDDLPLKVVEASSPKKLAEARTAAFSYCPSLDAPPPFVLTLVRYPKGDYLLLNAHHAATDGLGTLRLMTSVIRNYAGEPDPVPEVDPLAVRDLAALAGSASVKERIQRSIALLEILGAAATPPARIESQTDDASAPGYGFVTIQLDADESAKVARRRKKPGTVNDVLLAAWARTISLWNDERGAGGGRVTIMMPVNLRPEAWWHEIIANFSSYASVSLPPEAQDEFADALTAVTAQTQKLKKAGTAGLLIDLLELRNLVPPLLRAQMAALLPMTGTRIFDTTMLSNLGRLPEVAGFGTAGGAVREIWFSPPAPMPLGLTVGAASMGDRMFLTLRHRYALLNSAAAAEFGALFRAVLTGKSK